MTPLGARAVCRPATAGECREEWLPRDCGGPIRHDSSISGEAKAPQEDGLPKAQRAPLAPPNAVQDVGGGRCSRRGEMVEGADPRPGEAEVDGGQGSDEARVAGEHLEGVRGRRVPVGAGAPIRCLRGGRGRWARRWGLLGTAGAATRGGLRGFLRGFLLRGPEREGAAPPRRKRQEEAAAQHQSSQEARRHNRLRPVGNTPGIIPRSEAQGPEVPPTPGSLMPAEGVMAHLSVVRATVSPPSSPCFS